MQVTKDGTVGLLGILNSIVGVIDHGSCKGWGHIAAAFDGGKLVGFMLTEKTKCDS